MKTKRSAGVTLIEVLIASVILVGVMLISMATLYTATNSSSKGSAASDLETRGTRFLGLCRDDMAAAQYGNTLPTGSYSLILGVNPSTPIPIPAPQKHLSVAFQVPGNRDGAGVLIVGGAVVWGYYSPTNLITDLPATNHNKFYQELVCFLRFEADTVFKESTSSPDAAQCAAWDMESPRLFPPFPVLSNPSSTNLQKQILSMDLNGDGDRTDTYVRGKIVKLVYAPFNSPCALAHPLGVNFNGTPMTNLLLSREVLTDNVILRVESGAAGDFYSDFDGHGPKLHSDIDAIFRYVGPTGGVDEGMLKALGSDPYTVTPEPLDSTNAKGILISVIHGDYDGTPGGFLTRKNKQLIRTRSPQAFMGNPVPPPVPGP